MKLKGIAPVLSLLICIGCSNSTTVVNGGTLNPLNYSSNSTLVMWTSGCFGICPIYTVTLHWNDSVLFHRTNSWRNFSDTGRGPFDSSYSIASNDLARIDKSLKKIGFFTLDTLYTTGVTDNESVFFDFTSGTQHHKVENYAAVNQELDTLRNVIDSIVHTNDMLEH